MKRLIAITAVAAALAAIAPAAHADTTRTITVSGHGEAAGTPDSATLSAGVTTEAKTAAAALAANATRMNEVFAALRKLGVPDKKIQTSNFNISPQYAQQTGNGAPRIAGYQVNNQVNVAVDDVKKVGPALDALVAANANQINSVNFGIANPKPLLTDARSSAVGDAIDRAQTYAKAAGVSLGNIISISDGDFAVPAPAPGPVFRAMDMKIEATPISGGEQTVSANVTVVWEIH